MLIMSKFGTILKNLIIFVTVMTDLVLSYLRLICTASLHRRVPFNKLNEVMKYSTNR